MKRMSALGTVLASLVTLSAAGQSAAPPAAPLRMTKRGLTAARLPRVQSAAQLAQLIEEDPREGLRRPGRLRSHSSGRSRWDERGFRLFRALLPSRPTTRSSRRGRSAHPH
jgi:hypothetical protein